MTHSLPQEPFSCTVVSGTFYVICVAGFIRIEIDSLIATDVVLKLTRQLRPSQTVYFEFLFPSDSITLPAFILSKMLLTAALIRKHRYVLKLKSLAEQH